MNHDVIRGSLLRLADLLDKGDGLGAIYADRARELALEAQMCGVVGTERVRKLSLERYATSAVADELARAWSLAVPEESPVSHRSDDADDPGSLLRRMRQEVGRHRLAMRVLAVHDLASLAATGREVILVAKGVDMRTDDIERTVLHEIEGHALPRSRARGLFDVSSARGSDDQEGRAIALEEDAGMLGAGRKRELSRRHIAAMTVRAGADFVQTVRTLDTDVASAIRIAARAHRGGGLAREVAYLTSYVSYRASDPETRTVLRFGRVSLVVAGRLRGMSPRLQPYHAEMLMCPTPDGPCQRRLGPENGVRAAQAL